MQAHLCAAATMVWQDYTFLEKWIDHYGAAFSKTNLYVILHGLDEHAKDIASGCNVIEVPRYFDANFEKNRWRALSGYGTFLLQFYKAVIIGDCDEYVVPTQDLGKDLQSYILNDLLGPYTAPMGFNVFHDTDAPAPIDWHRPILQQAENLCSSASFTKPCILKRPVQLGYGGHGLIDTTFDISSKLMLLHLKYVDPAVWQPKMRKLVHQTKSFDTDDKNPVGIHWMKMGANYAFLERMRTAKVTQAADPLRQTHRILESMDFIVEDGVTKLRQLKGLARQFRVPDHLKHAL